MASKTLKAPLKHQLDDITAAGLIEELRGMIDQTRQSIATTIDSGITILYWKVGRINKEILKNTRADYGEKIVATVSRQLAYEYGKGFLEKSLRRMIQLATIFPDEQVLMNLAQKLTWSHFRLLIPIKDAIKIRKF